ncbi:MAG: carbonic anhydrase [Microcoleaceae cyanobacterium]
MDRRKLLKYLPIVAASAALSSIFKSKHTIARESSHVNWGYIGENGAEHWAELSPEYQVCHTGKNQSPINIKSPISLEPPQISINYKESPLNIINNGHTIQVNYRPGSQLKIGDKSFELLQFHFHSPSEHLLSEKSFPMEAHFVHKASDNTLAVLGIFIKVGRENNALKSIWDAMPMSKLSQKTVSEKMVNAAEILPKEQNFYRYFGSLTTPPCSEIVTWIVYKQPIEMSQRQIDKFAQLYPHNARPTRPLGQRFLLESS